MTKCPLYCFFFSETWYDGDNKPINIPGCSGHHTLRQGRAGGVSIFVKNKLSSCFMNNFSYENSSIEICTVKICNALESIHISGIYRPVSDNIDNFSSAIENILSNPQFPSSSNVIAGDVNVNLMSDEGQVGRMVDVMRSHHFLQTISSITRPGNHPSSSSLIDHVWINQLCGYNCGVVDTQGISDHYGTYIFLPFKTDKKNSETFKITFRDHSENHLHTFENLLSNYDWNNVNQMM